MTKRPIDDERIADWVDDELDEVQRTRFEAELRVNPQLRAAAEAYRDRVMALRAALRGGESLGPRFTDRVMAATAAQREERRWRILPLLGSALAASLLVGVWFVAQRLSTAPVDRDPFDKDSIAFARSAREATRADALPEAGAIEKEPSALIERKPTAEPLDVDALRANDSRQPAVTADDEPKNERLGFLEPPPDTVAGLAGPELRVAIESRDSLGKTAQSQLEEEAVGGSVDGAPAGEETGLHRRLRGIVDSESAAVDRESKDVFFVGRGGAPGASPGTAPAQPSTDLRGRIQNPEGVLLDEARRSALTTSTEMQTRAQSSGARESLGVLVYLVELPSALAVGGRAATATQPFELGVPMVPRAVLPVAPREVVGNDSVAEAPGAYVARPTDEVYTIEGEPQLVDAALGKLAEGVRRAAGRLSVRRWFAPPSTVARFAQPDLASRDGEPAEVTLGQESRSEAAQRPALDSTWIVIRRLPVALPPASGPSTPGPAGSQGPPPATTTPKKSGVEKSK
jgi:hypothetical protein